MSDILHRVGAMVPRDEVYDALTTIEGLARWWTEDTTGDPAVDGVISFRFAGAPAPGGFDMAVREAQPGALVRWEVVAGPEEWVGTQVRFDLTELDGETIVRFGHLGWTEPGEFMHHCSTKWATFLMSLKQLVETGTGAPSPHDVSISSWH